MPHTIHLAALKASPTFLLPFIQLNPHVQLLEAIGALTKDERNKAKSRTGVYQEASTESVDREQDGQTGDGEDDQDTEDVSPTSTIGSAVFKASFLPHSWLP
jgi:hypothetical protein